VEGQKEEGRIALPLLGGGQASLHLVAALDQELQEHADDHDVQDDDDSRQSGDADSPSTQWNLTENVSPVKVKADVKVKAGEAMFVSAFTFYTPQEHAAALLITTLSRGFLVRIRRNKMEKEIADSMSKGIHYTDQQVQKILSMQTMMQGSLARKRAIVKLQGGVGRVVVLNQMNDVVEGIRETNLLQALTACIKVTVGARQAPPRAKQSEKCVTAPLAHPVSVLGKDNVLSVVLPGIIGLAPATITRVGVVPYQDLATPPTSADQRALRDVLQVVHIVVVVRYIQVHDIDDHKYVIMMALRVAP
jgi:hypothetical protein